MTLQQTTFTIKKAIKFFFLSLAILLLGLNIYGLIQPIPTYKAIKNISLHKQNLIRGPKSRTIQLLRSVSLESIEKIGVYKLNEAFARSIIHYWPEKRNYFYIYENWLIYFLQKIESRFRIEKTYFTNIERFDWERVIQSGYGYCSQVTLALYDFLKEKGQKSDIIAVNGHVLLGTSFFEDYYLMDADFNVVIKASVEEIYNNPKIVEEAYRNAGQDIGKAKTISDMFASQEDNWIGSRDDYYPMLSNFYLIANFLKWALPMLLLSFMFLRNSLLKKRTSYV